MSINLALTRALTGGYHGLLRYTLSNRCPIISIQLPPFFGLRRALIWYRSFESAPQPVMDFFFLSFKGSRMRGNRSNAGSTSARSNYFFETSLQNAMLDRDYWNY